MYDNHVTLLHLLPLSKLFFLHSSALITLVLPSVCQSCFHFRAFVLALPHGWNVLVPDNQLADSFSKSLLRCHLSMSCILTVKNCNPYHPWHLPFHDSFYLFFFKASHTFSYSVIYLLYKVFVVFHC